MAVLKYCARCKGLRERGHKHRVKDTRPSARQRGYDDTWASTRHAYLDAFPICQWHEGCIEPSTDVHHRDGKGPKGPLGHDWTNLQGLCHSHHSQVSSQEQPGGFNA